VRKNSASTLAASVPCPSPCLQNRPTPSERVGPGSTELTVTPVPAVASAKPRARAICRRLGHA